MNISPVQNNNSQSFGMAFHLRGNGAKKLAETFNNTSDPDAVTRYFMERVAEPIQKLKSEVLYDGDKVLVKDTANSGDIVEILDTNYGTMRPFSDSRKSLCMHVNMHGENDIYRIFYPVSENEFSRLSYELALAQGDDLKLRLAREIAKDMDKKAAQKTYDAAQKAAKQARVDELAKNLQDLFG